MSGATLVLDPQFEALLREAAAKPGSVLLKRPPPRSLTGPFSGNDAVSVGMAGLSTPDKELLLVHRAEMAELLRDLALRALWEGRAYHGAFTRYIHTGQSIREPRREDLRRRITELREDRIPETAELQYECGVRRSGFDHLDQMSAYELSAVSYRFEPRTRTIVLAALDLAQTGQLQNSLPLFRRVLMQPVSDRERASAYEGIGHFYLRHGDGGSAMRAAERSCLTDSSYVIPRLNLIYLAMLVGDSKTARHASLDLDDSLSMDHPLLDDFLTSVRTQCAAKAWSSSAAIVHLARTLADELGPVGRKVALVFIEE